MYPYFVLGLSESATAQEVDAAYASRVREYPPDRDPERFQIVREAYEALSTPAKRRDARMFYMDATGRALIDQLPIWMQGRPRRRLSTGELATRVRELCR